MAWSVEFMVLMRADGIQPCQYIDSAYAYAHGLPYIIHISTRHVSFSILIGRNSVAEWLIVASTT
jgi:hypothetical protein